MARAVDQAVLGPDGRPANFDGAAWVSSDGRFWWNGSVWLPIRGRQRIRISGFVVVMAVIVLGVVGWLGYQYTHQPLPVAQGVSNARIVSPTEIQFDYQRATSCADVTFEYYFFNSAGVRVRDFAGSGHHSVVGMETYHVTVTLDSPLDPSIQSFTAIDTCHS